jgi:tetratricopeptide (TPR) repeat protein
MRKHLLVAAFLSASASMWFEARFATAAPLFCPIPATVAQQSLRPDLAETEAQYCRPAASCTQRNACAALLQPAAAKPEAQDVNKLFAACDEADTYNDIDNAVSACEAALASPGITAKQKARLLFKRGEAFYWIPRLEMALADLDQSIFIDGSLTEARLRRAWTNWRAQRYPQAFLEVTELLSQNDKDADVLFAYGYFVSSATGDTEKAIAAYRQALSINPNHYLARFNLAQKLYFDRQDVQAGFAELEKLIVAGREKVSKVRYWRDRHRETYDFYGNARETRALWYAYTRQSDKALKEYDWLIAAYPNVAEGYAGRGGARETLGDLTGALRDAERAIELDKWGDEQRYMRLRLLFAMKRPADVIAMATGIIQGSATDRLRGHAHFFRARAHEHRRENDMALDDFEFAFRHDTSYLSQMLQQMVERGYYDGKETDDYSDAARNGLRACILDPEC